MLLNLIIGLLAGLSVPKMERVLKGWAESIWLGRLPISDHEFDLAALLVILMVASLLTIALGADSNAFLLALGAFIGLFGKRIWARIQRGEP
ncbi:MAG: hypothetical protein AAGE03_08660 [Pseudomonadota bacterium]